MGKVFRGKFLEALKEPAFHRALYFNEQTAHLGTQAGFSQLIDQLYGKNWIVYAKPPFNGPSQVIDYIGRYTHRVAISNHRIVEVREGQVRFTYRNREKGDQIETLELTAHAIIQRFLLHFCHPASFEFAITAFWPIDAKPRP